MGQEWHRPTAVADGASFHNLSLCESRLSFQYTHHRLRDIESHRTKILACDTEFSETTGIADRPRG
jgi:hypothetical protein